MAIDVKCTDCGCEMEAPDNAGGKIVKCPDCGAKMTVPGSAKTSVKSQPGQKPAKRDSRAEVKADAAERPRRRRKDEEDEEERPRRRKRREDDEDDDEADDEEDDGSEALSSLIPYKNTRALIAYYCGVFGLIPGVGAILGPVALILGILGLRYAGEHRKAKGTGHAWAGIILGVIDPLITVLFIVLIHMEILALPW
jgi:hypothetical protein